MRTQSLVWLAAALFFTLAITAWLKWRQERQRTGARGRALEVIVDPDDWHDGACALAMTLALYGKRATVTELIPLVKGEDGRANALRMVRTAEARGLEARGIQLGHSANLESIHRGDILHLRRGGFLVFDEVRGQEVVIVNPTSGRVTRSIDALWRELSGVALLFGPEKAS